MMAMSVFSAGPDGLMVELTCENHPELRWSCKKVALSFDDKRWRYNGRRNLFFKSHGFECDCSTHLLYALIEGGVL